MSLKLDRPLLPYHRNDTIPALWVGLSSPIHTHTHTHTYTHANRIIAVRSTHPQPRLLVVVVLAGCVLCAAYRANAKPSGSSLSRRQRTNDQRPKNEAEGEGKNEKRRSCQLLGPCTAFGFQSLYWWARAGGTAWCQEPRFSLFGGGGCVAERRWYWRWWRGAVAGVGQSDRKRKFRWWPVCCRSAAALCRFVGQLAPLDIDPTTPTKLYLFFLGRRRGDLVRFWCQRYQHRPTACPTRLPPTTHCSPPTTIPTATTTTSPTSFSPPKPYKIAQRRPFERTSSDRPCSAHLAKLPSPLLVGGRQDPRPNGPGQKPPGPGMATKPPTRRMLGERSAASRSWKKTSGRRPKRRHCSVSAE